MSDDRPVVLIRDDDLRDACRALVSAMADESAKGAVMNSDKVLPFTAVAKGGGKSTLADELAGVSDRPGRLMDVANVPLLGAQVIEKALDNRASCSSRLARRCAGRQGRRRRCAVEP